MTKKLRIILLAGTVGFVGLGARNSSRFRLLVSSRPAEARVGRPLTPVSVAGVARRTVRRCAVGVYNC